MADYLAEHYELPACLAGDTFPGLTVNSIKINGSAPTNSLSEVWMQLRTAPDATAAVKNFHSSSSNITITSASTWAFTVNAFTIDLDPDIYYYDIQTKDSSGTIRTYLRGHWNVGRDTTR